MRFKIICVLLYKLVIDRAHRHYVKKKKEHLLGVLVRFWKIDKIYISDKRYIIFIYEEIQCYKVKNK